ncbi:MAG: hypothetical protein PHQ52_03240 [Candidatus Omnitrophica bacterium]|nr:hypothetical protein [Candidatus Omnitrophota bacterium]
MKTHIKVYYVAVFLSLFFSHVSHGQVFETPSEVFVKTRYFNVSVWKNNLTNGRIDVYDKETQINLFPFFYFGSNSSDKNSVGLFNRNNHYVMFMGPANSVTVDEQENKTIITAIYPSSQIRYDGSRKLSGTTPDPISFSGKTSVTVYHDIYRIDVQSSQEIKVPLYTHIAWFSQLNISDANYMDFGVEQGFSTDISPWAELKFMHLDPKKKVFFKQASFDEKPPFKVLSEKEEFLDYLIAGNDNSRYMIYAPSWQNHASLGYNRKNIPDNSILFHKNGGRSARIIFITKDTTLGSGRDVLELQPGVYENNMSIIKLDENENAKDVYRELALSY